MTTLGPGGWRVIPEPCAMRVAAWRVVIVIVRGPFPAGSSFWGSLGWDILLYMQSMSGI